MITRMVRVQLVIFSVLTLVTAATIAFVYADLPAKYGWWGQTYVTATFEDGAGIYTSGNVTYRGVGEVGEVTDLDRNKDGSVDVRFRYDSALDVPANVRAEIRSVSAVGEFYVDLVPPADPVDEKLHDGDHIPIERTSVPLAIAPVLTDVNDFLQAIPKDSMSVFLEEAAEAFEDLGPDLVKLVMNTQRLVDEANQNYQATSDLLRDVGPLLDTQNQIDASIRGAADHLASFTDMLKVNDDHVDESIDDAGHTVQAADGIVRDISPTLPTLLANLTTVGDVLSAYRPGLEQIFLVFPQVVAKEQVTTRTPGLARLDIAVTLGNPPGCAIGYPQVGDPLTTRSPFDLSDYPAVQDSYCKVPQDDPRAVRGARNLPCFEGAPGRRAATAEDCRGAGYTEALVGRLPLLELPNVNGQASSFVSNADGVPSSEGTYYAAGHGQGRVDTWQQLLLPMGGER